MRWPAIRTPELRWPEWLERIPALTLGLVALWALVSLVVALGWSSPLRAADQALYGAARFAIQHPVVQVDDRLLPVVRSLMPGFESNEMFAFLRKGVTDDPSHPQVRFEGLSRDAFARLDAHPYRRLGVVPADPRAGAFATHLLLHAGWVHLALTVLVFLLAGPVLETLWGRRVLAGALPLWGLGGALLFQVVHSGADRALLGASALAGGCACAVAVRLREREIDVLGWLGPRVGAELRVPAWSLAGLWLAGEALLWWGLPGALPAAVDNALGYTAHATGAALGAGTAWLVARLGWEQRFGRPLAPALARKAAPRRFDFQEVLRAREAGDAERAWALLEAETARSARNRDAVTTFWQMAIERGTPEAAASAMAQLVSEELRRGAEEVAVSHWRELTEHASPTPLAAAVLLRLAPIVQRVDGDENAVVVLQQVAAIEGLPAARLGELARRAAGLDPELARRAARRALEGEGLDETARAELETLAGPRAAREGAAPEPEAKEEKKELPVNVFYEESDRSEFGLADDLSALDEAFPDGALFDAVPLGFAEAGLGVDLEQEGERCLPWVNVRALSVAGVHGLGPKPVLLIDLMVDGAGSTRPLRVIRMRSDRFDPRRLREGESDAMAAIRWLVEGILARSDARPLPDPDGARARPVRLFASLDEYHARVLRPAGPEFA